MFVQTRFFWRLLHRLTSVFYHFGHRRRSHCKNWLQKRRRHRTIAGRDGQCLVLAGSNGEFPIRCFSSALFIVGLGFAMLQIAANPYVTILGPERTASSRLNLAQAFNSVGTTIGPLIGGYLIFQYFAKTGAHGADSVKVPYLMFCIVFLILAVIFFLPPSAACRRRQN